MAFATIASEGQDAVVAAPGTSVGLSPLIRDNTREIVFLNLSTTEWIYVGLGTVGAAVPAATAIVQIPPEASYTWSIGTLRERPGPVNVAGAEIIVDATGAATCHVTFVNHVSDGPLS
jgi:hypothetical protein